MEKITSGAIKCMILGRTSLEAQWEPMPEHDSLKKNWNINTDKNCQDKLVYRKLKWSCGHFNRSIPLRGQEFIFLAMLSIEKIYGVFLTVASKFLVHKPLDFYVLYSASLPNAYEWI